MIPSRRERAAEQFWPGDHLRQDGALFLCQRVSVSPETVEIEADRIIGGKRAGAATLTFAHGELVRIPAAGSTATTVQHGLL